MPRHVLGSEALLLVLTQVVEKRSTRPHFAFAEQLYTFPNICILACVPILEVKFHFSHFTDQKRETWEVK